MRIVAPSLLAPRLRKPIWLVALLVLPALSFVVGAQSPAESVTLKGTMQLGSQDYQRASDLYFDKCAGCHGVDREGSAGSELFGALMQRVGDDAIKHVLHFGTPDGMPNWGTSERLSDDDVERLSQFLQLPEPGSPGFSADQVAASWRQSTVPDQKSKKRSARRVSKKWQPKNLFVSLLHDVGRVLLIDGPSKEVLFSVETGVAPTAIELSLDSRYLYVLHRDGRVVSIDLQLSVPQVVASVRVGYEARAIAMGGSRRKPWLVVGSQAPSQLVQLDPQTLRPLRTTALPLDSRLPAGADGRVEQILNLGRRRLSALMTTGIPGDVYVLRRPYSTDDDLFSRASRVAAELRSGSVDVSGRYAIFPTNSARVAVFDSFEQRVLPMVSVPGLKAGSAGTSFVDPDYGPVWASSSMFSSKVVLIGTDPKRHAEHAWKPVRTLKTANAGSMYVASHPKSTHLWVDSAVSSSTEAAASVTVFDRERLEEPGKVIALYELIDLAGFPGRVLHPQFNAAGDELWLTIWNRIDRRSAIVVIDDDTLEIKTVIEDTRLITPIRTFSVASLLAEKRRR